jgi:RNA polymerase sigma-70 factor (ECF subfamily)
MSCLALYSDEDLIRGLQASDTTTLDRLVGEYWRRLVRYADGILAGDGSAEDVVQETFCRLWTRRHELKLAGSLRALLYTLTKNAAIDERRRGIRHATKVAAAGDPVMPPSPLEHAAASELATAVDEAIARLPARRREIFLLVRMQGFTYQEVAEWLGLSPQTVANQMSAAMASLREDLARFGVTAARRPCETRRPAHILPFRTRRPVVAYAPERASA